jgi:hypothetical protein
LFLIPLPVSFPRNPREISVRVKYATTEAQTAGDDAATVPPPCSLGRRRRASGSLSFFCFLLRFFFSPEEIKNLAHGDYYIGLLDFYMGIIYVYRVYCFSDFFSFFL